MGCMISWGSPVCRPRWPVVEVLPAAIEAHILSGVFAVLRFRGRGVGVGSAEGPGWRVTLSSCFLLFNDVLNFRGQCPHAPLRPWHSLPPMGHSLIFLRGGALGNLLRRLMGCWPGASGSFWVFLLAAGCQGGQEGEGCWSQAWACSPVVGPFRGLSYLELGNHGGWFKSLLGRALV